MPSAECVAERRVPPTPLECRVPSVWPRGVCRPPGRVRAACDHRIVVAAVLATEAVIVRDASTIDGADEREGCVGVEVWSALANSGVIPTFDDDTATRKLGTNAVRHKRMVLVE